MGVKQPRLDRAINEIKHGTDVSQLDDEYKISTQERIIKEVCIASPHFCGDNATWIG
jgi:hypothetical protein